MVYEELRRLCLFDQLRAAGRREVYWLYLRQFERACSMRSGRFTTLADMACSDQTLRTVLTIADMPRGHQLPALEFNETAFDECAGVDAASGAYVDVDAPHPLLQRQLEARVDAGASRTGRGRISFLPTVVINNAQVRRRRRRHGGVQGGRSPPARFSEGD